MSVRPRKVVRMSTALYRRYRPDDFASVIGQEQVTKPLIAALESNRVTHAYLFSGPRGCGKTTSARILARCLNCAEGPTATPCGKCDSCNELATGGPGSLDVVEIDAASHNGVDDARELRERAAFAPVRDRYKIFILDEAHMVTQQGFNALLKLVEEPPEHVKFIFATTEPDKVLGTIRSRTHHYPFRLVPPEVLEKYLQELCDKEGIEPMPGVLPLVLRAGGGSVRDTLSVLDQLMAGAVDNKIDYHLALALLGYTDSALLDAVTQALSEKDGNRVYEQVEQMVESGHDPRRFVEDLLQRLRDLLILAVAGSGAKQVLHALAPDQVERMLALAQSWGAAGISRAADLTSKALNQMAGATSPRLQLELLCARILLPDGQLLPGEAPAPGTAGLEGPTAPVPASSGRGPSSEVSGAQLIRQQMAQKNQDAQTSAGSASSAETNPEPAGQRTAAPLPPHEDDSSTPAPVSPQPAAEGWGTPATPGGQAAEPGADMVEKAWRELVTVSYQSNRAQGAWIRDNLLPGKVHQGVAEVVTVNQHVYDELVPKRDSFSNYMQELIKHVLHINVKVEIVAGPKGDAPVAGPTVTATPAVSDPVAAAPAVEEAAGEPAEKETVAEVVEIKPGITGQIPKQTVREEAAWGYQLTSPDSKPEPAADNAAAAASKEKEPTAAPPQPAVSGNGWGPVRTIPGADPSETQNPASVTSDETEPKEVEEVSPAQLARDALANPASANFTEPEPEVETVTDNSIDPDDPDVPADEVAAVAVIQSLLGGTVVKTIEK